VDNIVTVADHRLIKIIINGEEVVGFLSPFPVSPPLPARPGGNLLPSVCPTLLLEMRAPIRFGQRHGHPARFPGAWRHALLY